MTTSLISTGTWASIDEHCPVRVKLDGDDLATLVVGDDEQSLELTFNAAGLRRLAEVSRRAVTSLERGDADLGPTSHRG